MSDVFLSHSREDRDVAQKLASALEREGLTVFVDATIAAGSSWVDVIGSAIREARAVVSLWSQHSIGSAWLLDEASLARDENKLIPVVLDSGVQPPLGFRRYNFADLTGWDGEQTHPGYQHLVVAVKRMVGDRGLTAPQIQPPPPPVITRSRGPRERVRERSDASIPAGTQIESAPEQPYNKPMMAPFSSIFIAHSGADKPKIKPVIEVLIKSGFVIWIDRPNELKLTKKQLRSVRGISFSADWQRAISQAVQRARVVLAFWSNDAVDARRERFYYELYMGMVQRKLMQCRIEEVPPQKIGLPFTFEQMADLKDFKANAYNPDLDDLMLQIAKFQPRRL